MLKQDYYPPRLGDQSAWLHNFKGKLPGYASGLGLAAADVTARLLDVDNALYALEAYRPAVASFHDAAFRRIEDALGNTQLPGAIAWPDFTAPTPMPATVDNGCLRRLFDYITNVIKKSAGYSEAIGTDLRIVAPPAPAPDPMTAPSFTLRATGGHKLEVVWTKGVFDGVKLEFDLGAAGMQSDVDLRPNYVLNWLPAAGTSAIIKVRLRYIYKGEEFGNWTPWQNWTLTGD